MVANAFHSFVIGVDFDNTLADYDDLFHTLAVEAGLVATDSVRTKQAVRDSVRLLPGGEILWRRLQALAYGERILESLLFPGAMAFLSRARELGCAIRIVSHKTRYPAEGEADLHKAALTFMEANGLFDPQGGGLSPEHVHFEPTRATKAERIKAIGCTHFIDDLPEMLTHPGFPPGVKRYLFSPSGGSALPGIVRIAGFAQLSELLFAAEGT